MIVSAKSCSSPMRPARCSTTSMQSICRSSITIAIFSPVEIAENKEFEDLGEMWLRGDHYKWRVMRSNGVPEEYITGDKPDRERFQKFAEALPMAIGNPMYHWTNLELHVFFGYDGVLNGDTAEEVWNLCNDKLQHDPKLTVRGLIEQSNVAFIGTTDDPIDDLYWHKKIKEDPTIKFTVAPSFRPDKAININKPGFAEYMAKLAAVVGKEKLACIDCVTDALTKRIEFFAEMGCRASDHGLDYIPYREATKEEVNAIYQKAMAGEAVTAEETEKYQTYILIPSGQAVSPSGHRHADPLQLPARREPQDEQPAGPRHRL